MKRFVLTLLFFVLSAAGAQADVTWSAKMGSGGKVKPGRWNYALIKIDNPGGKNHKALIKIFSPGARDHISSLTVSILKRSSKVHHVYFYVNPWEPPNAFKVSMERDGLEPLERIIGGATVVKQGSAMVGILSKPYDIPKTGINAYFKTFKRQSDGRGDVVTNITAEDLPDTARGYNALSTLIAGRLNVQKISVHPDKVQAIRNYVSSGGRLIILGGGDAMSFRGTFFEELAGLSIDKNIVLNAREAIPARWSNKTSKSFSEAPDTNLMVTKCEEESAEVFANAVVDRKMHVLVYRNNYGLGEVFFVCFDTGPLYDWSGLETLWGEMLDREDESGMDSVGPGSENRIGSWILTKGSEPVGVVLIFFLTIIYALVIGPGDYFFLKANKFFRHSYYTFIGIIAGGTLFAYLVSTLLVGTSMHTRCLAWMDVPDDMPHSGGAYFQVFSPRRGRVKVIVDSGAIPVSEYRPDTSGGFGGMSSRQESELRCVDGSYQFKRLFKSQSKATYTCRFSDKGAYKLDYTFNIYPKFPKTGTKTKITVISGHFVNPLPITLEDAILVCGKRDFRHYVRLGTLPGGTKRVFKEIEVGVGERGDYRNKNDHGYDEKLSHGNRGIDKAWKFDNPRFRNFLTTCLSRSKPMTNAYGGFESGTKHYHPDFTAVDNLRTPTDAVIIAFARGYLPLGIEARRHGATGSTIVRFPVKIIRKAPPPKGTNP